jgi:hypothetical protein
MEHMTESDRSALKVGDRVLMQRLPGISGETLLITGTVSKRTATKATVTPDPWAVNLMPQKKVFTIKSGICDGESYRGNASIGAPRTYLAHLTDQTQRAVDEWVADLRKRGQVRKVVGALSNPEVVKRLTKEQAAALFGIVGLAAKDAGVQF